MNFVVKLSVYDGFCLIFLFCREIFIFRIVIAITVQFSCTHKQKKK